MREAPYFVLNILSRQATKAFSKPGTSPLVCNALQMKTHEVGTKIRERKKMRFLTEKRTTLNSSFETKKNLIGATQVLSYIIGVG